MSENMNNLDVEMTEEEREYAKKFVQAYVSSYLYNSNSMPNYNVSPSILNQALKNANMNPALKDRDTVEEMIANPKYYEKSLRELSQHLLNVIMPIKRLRSYYANILKFDYTVIPMNVDFNTMKTTAFKKAETRVYDWLESLNPRKSFKRLVAGCLGEDAKFYYLREVDGSVALQEMPSDYCMIIHEDELSYRYAFDMNYFLKSGVELDGFDPIFKKYYTDIFTNNKKIDRLTANWVELDPDKAFVFKFDMLQAGLTPPLIGLFIDAVEIDTYRNLKASKTALEAYKLVIGGIPRHKDNKSGNKKNDFALSSKMAAEFSALIKNSLPEGVDFKTTPFEDVKVFEFGNANKKTDDISTSALSNLLANSGSSQTMSMDKPTQSTVKSSQKIDESFVEHLYFQAEDFINHQLKRISPKYIFKVKLEGTIFDTEERKKDAKEFAALGVLTDKIGACLGYTPKEFDQAIMYFQSRGYPENLKPVMSAFQTSNTKEETKPEKSDAEISDNGAISKDHDLNN